MWGEKWGVAQSFGPRLSEIGEWQLCLSFILIKAPAENQCAHHFNDDVKQQRLEGPLFDWMMMMIFLLLFIFLSAIKRLWRSLFSSPTLCRCVCVCVVGLIPLMRVVFLTDLLLTLINPCCSDKGRLSPPLELWVTKPWHFCCSGRSWWWTELSEWWPSTGRASITPIKQSYVMTDNALKKYCNYTVITICILKWK